jgi:septum formation protein
VKLILASASPRRAEILRNAGFTFDVQPARTDESLRQCERAEDYVRRLAESKAQAIAKATKQAAFVVGADTTVLVAGEILGKPSGAADARRMLLALSGRTHEVLTGIAVALAPNGDSATHVESTCVTFLPLSDVEIETYIATREPFDKAGAYGIQGIGGRFISRIEGDYFNVMGLPVARLWQMLREMGWCENAASAQK